MTEVAYVVIALDHCDGCDHHRVVAVYDRLDAASKRSRSIHENSCRSIQHPGAYVLALEIQHD